VDLRLSSEQEQLVESFASLLDKHSTAERVRECEASGFDPELWAQLRAAGIVEMAVPETDGGWGASLLDLALVAEQVGRTIASAPAIEAQIAARLLAGVGTDQARSLLTSVLTGEQLVTIALHPVREGIATLVPAAPVADIVLALDAGRLIGVAPTGCVAVENLGSMPLADVSIGGGTELASGAAAVAAFQAAVDEWLVLTGAALGAIGARALRIGVDYVKGRNAFGVPIGSFQAISHRLADSAAALDGAQLLSREAAWAHEDDVERFGELAPMSFAYAYESARDATYRSLHFHGGYGFMMEYDIQLYYRRARAWANVYAEPAVVYQRAADARFGPVPVAG
jgi:alkylation response protein AidB-like acyl-CoA dehydrogenase